MIPMKTIMNQVGILKCFIFVEFLIILPCSAALIHQKK